LSRKRYLRRFLLSQIEEEIEEFKHKMEAKKLRGETSAGCEELLELIVGE
jgi:hypothetical protein